jgi:hypothetical protein
MDARWQTFPASTAYLQFIHLKAFIRLSHEILFIELNVYS